MPPPAPRPTRDTPDSPRAACRVCPGPPRRSLKRHVTVPRSSLRLAEFDRAAFAPRTRRGFREFERLHAIGDGRANGLALRDGIEEMRDFERICRAIPFKEE